MCSAWMACWLNQTLNILLRDLCIKGKINSTSEISCTFSTQILQKKTKCLVRLDMNLCILPFPPKPNPYTVSPSCQKGKNIAVLSTLLDNGVHKEILVLVSQHHCCVNFAVSWSL